MKNMLRLSVVLSIIVILVLIGCNGTQENGVSGTIAISISSIEASNNMISSDAASSGARAVYPPTSEMLAEMQFRITLQGPTGSQSHTIPTGATYATFTVTAGLWNITVEAYYQGSLYATGSNSVDVRPRQSNSVSIQMGSAAVTPPDTVPEYGIVFMDGDGQDQLSALNFSEFDDYPAPDDYSNMDYTLQVSIHNIGKNPTGTLTITNDNDVEFELLVDGFEVLSFTLSLGIGDYEVFSIRPKNSLSIGSYTATIRAENSDISEQISGPFIVIPKPTSSIR